MSTPPDPVLLYHITHLDNLPGILQDGCLHCQQQLGTSGQHPVNIAHIGIQDRRALTTVPCGPGGILHDYVPFYFAPRSPMLYAIHRGNVETYDGGQTPLVYLVSTATHIQQAKQQFVFTDGHPTVAFTQFYTELADLTHVDWPLMRAQYWNDTPQDPDRKRRRQAEFLVYNQVSLSTLIGIGLINERIQQHVEELLAAQPIKLPVRVRRNWYY